MAHLAVVFLIAALTALISTPAVRRIAFAVGMVDQPGERRMHAVPMPRGGGVAIYIAFWLSLGLSGHPYSELWPLWLASTIMVVVGLIDDRWDLHWYAKLGGQLVAALTFVVWGGQIEFVTNPFGGNPIYIGSWSIPLTVLWLVGLANMMNFIDGLDGLAAGVAVIASIPLLIVALSMGRMEAALLTTAIAAATLGFLPHNFNPARIIMGDTGAMFIGFVLGAISVEGALKGPTALAFVVPVLALGLPIFDTLFAVTRRWANRRPFYKADRDHLHHRLLEMGLSHRQAVLTLYGISAIMGIGSLLSIVASVGQNILIMALLLAGSVLFVRRVGGLRGRISTSGDGVAKVISFDYNDSRAKNRDEK